jgi:PAS domain-containing protein
MEFQALRKNGSEFPIELSLFSWQAGSLRFFSGIIRDITERKRMEEDIYRKLYDNAPDMLASIDPRTAKIVQCNQTIATALGYTRMNWSVAVFSKYTPPPLLTALKKRSGPLWKLACPETLSFSLSVKMGVLLMLA